MTRNTKVNKPGEAQQNYLDKINKRNVLVLKKRAIKSGNREWVWDKELKGWGAIAYPNGTVSFVVRWRDGRRLAQKAIGSFPVLQPEAAKKKALDTLHAIKNEEKDPRVEAKADRAELSVRELTEEWLKSLESGDKAKKKGPRKPRTVENYRFWMEKHVLPEIGNLRVSKVTSEEVERIHEALSDHVTTANRVINTLRALYSWGQKKGKVPKKVENPARGIERFDETRRERLITEEELKGLWDAMANLESGRIASENKRSPAILNLFRFLVLTGCRLGEGMSLKWTAIDYEKGTATWTDHKTSRQTQKPKVLQLSTHSLAFLKALPKFLGNDFVFPGSPRKKADETKPTPAALIGVQKAWQAVRERAGEIITEERQKAHKQAGKRGKAPSADLTDIHIHDLRHAFVSYGVAAGVPIRWMATLAGHSDPSTTEKRYTHAPEDPVRQAANTVGETLAKLVGM